MKHGVDLLRLGTVASLVALIVLGIAWEGWVAPIRPGGSWLTLKVVPLLFPLRGLLHGRRYTYQWASMFILAYFTEGVVRAWSEVGPVRTLAVAEIVLSLIFFACAVLFARATAPSRMRPTPSPDATARPAD